MTPKMAARKLNRSPQQICALIRQGKLQARRLPSRYNSQGQYDISQRSVSAFLRRPCRVKNAKIDQETADKIREDWLSGMYLQKDLALKYDLSRSSISEILAGKKWAS